MKDNTMAIRLMNLSHKLRKVESGQFTDQKLMKYEFDTLAIISNVIAQKEKVCASDIAEINGMKMSAVSRLLSNMESKDLVYREIDPTDRRNILVKITDNGQKTFDKFMKGVSSFLDGILFSLPDPERAVFLSMTLKMFDVVESELDKVIAKTERQQND